MLLLRMGHSVHEKKDSYQVHCFISIEGSDLETPFTVSLSIKKGEIKIHEIESQHKRILPHLRSIYKELEMFLYRNVHKITVKAP